jgi:hypothetical protein
MCLDDERAGGGLACFLPLPERCPWPVWLHGGFDLDASRRGITRKDIAHLRDLQDLVRGRAHEPE